MDHRAQRILDIINERRITFLRQIADTIPLDSNEVSRILGKLELLVIQKSKPKAIVNNSSHANKNQCLGIKKDGEQCTRKHLPGQLYCKSHLPNKSTLHLDHHDTSNANETQPEPIQNNMVYKATLKKPFSPEIDFLPKKKDNLTMICFRGKYYYYDISSRSVYYFQDNHYHHLGHILDNKLV